MITSPVSQKHKHRIASLLPGGKPRYVRCYRDDSSPLDPWTVIFTGRAAPESCSDVPRQWPYVGLSGHGFSNHQPCDTIPQDGHAGGAYVWPPPIGRKCHLGIRVEWDEVPEPLRRVALADYREIWGATIGDWPY